MIEDLRAIKSFLSTIDLRLNMKKTNFAIFSLSPKNFHPFNVILVDNENIERVENFKYLGIIFDQHLTWKPHAEHVLSQICPYIHTLSKIRYYLDNKSLMKIYYAYIHSRLTYCLPVWQGMSSEIKCLLQRAQSKAIKFINFLPPTTSTNQLFDNKLLKFSDHIIFENIFFIYKVFSGLIKCDFKLSTNFETTNRSTRQSFLIRTPQFISSKAQASICYIGIVQFNMFLKFVKENKNALPNGVGQTKSWIGEFVRRP